MEILGYFSVPTWLILLIVLFVTYCVYASKNYGTFKSMGIPGPSPLPVIGNILPYFSAGLKGAQTIWYKKYGQIFGVYEMNVPNLFIGDPEMLREILVKEFHNFTNRRIPFKQRPPLDRMLTMLKDTEWKYVRTTITPTFSSGKLKKMTGLINATCDKFVENLTKTAENNEDVEIKLACSAFSMDVIGSTAFGIQVNTQDNPDEPIARHGRAFLTFSPIVLLIMLFCPRLLPLYGKLVPSALGKATDYFNNLVRETLRQRKTDSEKRNDFLQLMVNADSEASKEAANTNGTSESTDETKRKGLTFEEIAAQSIIFFFGGFETTASTLSMVFYSLALNPDALEKALQEVDRVLGKDECITYEQVGELHYLDQVICETQRLYPAATRIDRVCSATTTIKGLTIPKDMVVSIPIECIHYDQQYWPDPEKFDPDRFRPEVKSDINPFTYMPFGYGPRNCIAMRLALLEMKMAVARVLQKLRPFKVTRTQEKPEFSKVGFLIINGGSWIGMKKRE